MKDSLTEVGVRDGPSGRKEKGDERRVFFQDKSRIEGLPGVAGEGDMSQVGKGKEGELLGREGKGGGKGANSLGFAKKPPIIGRRKRGRAARSAVENGPKEPLRKRERGGKPTLPLVFERSVVDRRRRKGELDLARKCLIWALGGRQRKGSPSHPQEGKKKKPYPRDVPNSAKAQKKKTGGKDPPSDHGLVGEHSRARKGKGRTYNGRQGALLSLLQKSSGGKSPFLPPGGRGEELL